MGPFNRVTDYKISDADEVYRQHDLGYGRLRARGYNPYISWNKYDQDLMESPSTGWSDYLAKAVFGAKKVLTYGMPELWRPQFKSVSSQPEKTFLSPESEYLDYKNRTMDDYNFNQLTSGNYSPEEATQARRWASKGEMYQGDTSTSVPSGSFGGGKFHSRVRYENF